VTTKSRGSGLGLAICSSVADAHRAVLSVRNHIGRAGCTFAIEFPVPQGRPSQLHTKKDSGRLGRRDPGGSAPESS
jgi:K+-sensing histidine kinase KdpD